MKTPVGEISIAEQLRISELKTDILQIAHHLETDELYTKQDTINDLLAIIRKNDL